SGSVRTACGVLNVLALSAEASGGDADHALEMAGEKALVSEAGCRRDPGDGPALAPQRLCAGDPNPQVGFVRRQAGLTAEGPMKVKGTQVRNSRQLVERDGVLEFLVQEFLCAADGNRLAAGAPRLRNLDVATSRHGGEKLEQQGIGLESSFAAL